MRKIIFCAANSVDNFIATKDGGVDWLMDSDEVNEMLTQIWKTIDTVVLGRNSYEFSAANGMDGFPGVETYVFSHTLDPANHPNVRIVSGDVAAIMRELKGRDGGAIFLMGGAAIARDCFRAGLIDELGLNIHPVLLGGGIPFFLEMEEPVDLELTECRELPHGCVALTYRVKR